MTVIRILVIVLLILILLHIMLMDLMLAVIFFMNWVIGLIHIPKIFGLKLVFWTVHHHREKSICLPEVYWNRQFVRCWWPVEIEAIETNEAIHFHLILTSCWISVVASFSPQYFRNLLTDFDKILLVGSAPGAYPGISIRGTVRFPHPSPSVF